MSLVDLMSLAPHPVGLRGRRSVVARLHAARLLRLVALSGLLAAACTPVRRDKRLCNPQHPDCPEGLVCDFATSHCVSPADGGEPRDCGAGGECSESGSSCLGDEDCPQPGNPCQKGTCRDGACGTTNLAANVSCAGNGRCDDAGRCIGPVGPSCRGTSPLYCQGVSPDGAPETANCCHSILVGGSFSMGRNTGGDDECPITMECSSIDEPEHPATITPFYLDTFEVTVGRFRKFYLSGGGTWVAPGAGEHPKIADSGWAGAAWNAKLPTSGTRLLSGIISCLPHGNSTWPVFDEPSTSDPEQRPVNCVTWYEAFAFCAYDGGRLPTEAEWEFAAAGGDANRLFPWGSDDPTLPVLPANYDRNIGNAKTPVGSFPRGVGRFGQVDLAGSVSEWVLDTLTETWYSSFVGNPCLDCANLPTAAGSVGSFRGHRGGAWSNSRPQYLRAAARVSEWAEDRSANIGIRCAHDAARP